MRRHPLSLAVSAALILLFVAGCSPKLSQQTGLTASDLFARGEKKAQEKKYREAAEAFQVLLERFPTSPLAAKAQFGLATNRMANEESIEAEVAFDDFLRLYPADPKVPDALYLKGNLLFRQILPPGRDQGKTLETIKTYTLLLEREKDTPRALEAAGRIKELRNRLALSESLVVKHYLSRKLYDSAEARARRAIASYPEAPAAENLLSLLAQALEKEGKREEAAAVRKTLSEKYPGAGGKKR